MHTGFFHPHLQESSLSSVSLIACSWHRNLTPDDQNEVDNSTVMNLPVDSILNGSLPQ